MGTMAPGPSSISRLESIAAYQRTTSERTEKLTEHWSARGEGLGMSIKGRSYRATARRGWTACITGKSTQALQHRRAMRPLRVILCRLREKGFPTRRNMLLSSSVGTLA